MAESTPESFKTYGFSYDEQLVRARRYKDDLEKGGWKVVHKDKISTFWVKSFPDEAIPLKVLFEYNMPLSAEQYSQVISASNVEYRSKWDKARSTQVLEAFPDNGGHIMAITTGFSWPINDREFIVFSPPKKEIEWYGKRAIYNGVVNATYPSRPPNQDAVRATNGGNIYIAIPDEKNPENACTLFGLINNDYAGSIPHFAMRWSLSRRVGQKFSLLFESMVDGYNNYIAPKK